jgi:cold shock CspA family protein
VDIHVAAGDVVGAILEQAKDADLIVMGSRATRGPGDPYLGSAGMAVAASSPCSVLVVRSAAPEGVVAAGAEVRPEVSVPIEIAYENMEPSPIAERHVLRGITRMERVGPDLMRIRVTLARRNPRHLTGNLFDIHLEFDVPGPDVVVSRTSSLHHENEDLVTAIGEAFDQARRELLTRHAVERGDVKSHEQSATGVVTEVFPDYGFIRADDGRVIYFHRNSVLHGGWDDLDVGTDVRFVDEPGDEGPQATSVTVTGRHHTVA